MSYDYDALVANLAKHRAQAATAAADEKDDDESSTRVESLQEALQVFEELSGHCPMTPLLWMQYAHDMSALMQSLSASSASKAALQTRLQTLELALNEFPGSAILQLHYCELFVQSILHGGQEDAVQVEQAHVALIKALQQVGGGSHRGEGELIAQLYRVYALFAVHCKDKNMALQSFLQRAQTPIQEANEDLKEEAQEFCKQHNIPWSADLSQALEDARRFEAKAYSRLIPLENEVDMAMHQEQITYSDKLNLTAFEETFWTTSVLFTKAVLLGNNLHDRSFWMGLGGAATATAFLKYATAARKFKLPADNDDEQAELQKQQHHLVLNIYERAIAECPTVESVWLAYMKHLVWLWEHEQKTALKPTPQMLKTATARAVRNCPFSLALAQQQLLICLLVANQPNSEFVMDPEELLGIVSKALDSKFLPTPGQYFDLYTTAIRVVQRRILALLATSVIGTKYDPSHTKSKQAQPPAMLQYDDAELLPTRNTNGKGKNGHEMSIAVLSPLDDDAWQEVQDLCEEIRDMFEAANSRLNQDHASWTEGRAMLRQEWAKMEQYVLTPLLTSSNPEELPEANGNGNSSKDDAVFSQYEKVIRLHNPSHPDDYRALIQYFSHHGMSLLSEKTRKISPGEVLSRLRQVRGLYQKGVHSVGKSKPKDASELLKTATATVTPRDYDSALTSLCHEYQEFERTFGSEQSLADATRLMQKKLQKTTVMSNKRQTQREQQQRDVHNGEDSDDMVVDEEGDGKVSSKRKASDASANEAQYEPSKKRRMAEATTEDETKPEPQAKTQLQPKAKPPKVKIGHMFHKAHAFTVRISNLTVGTQEMDLIEAFRDTHKCGPVVHAKIVREKPFHAKGHKEAKTGISKGWGLLQFEERESVEKALELNGLVEINGNKVQVERSHVPAVGIVPPGMHRPGAKQQKKKLVSSNEAGGTAQQNEEKNEKTTEGKKSNTPSFGVLAFRPRGVVQKKQEAGPKKSHPKVKLAVPSVKEDDNKN